LDVLRATEPCAVAVCKVDSAGAAAAAAASSAATAVSRALTVGLIEDLTSMDGRGKPRADAIAAVTAAATSGGSIGPRALALEEPTAAGDCVG